MKIFEKFMELYEIPHGVKYNEALDKFEFEFRKTLIHQIRYEAFKAGFALSNDGVDELRQQLTEVKEDRRHYGVHLATALRGDKLVSEPVDQRLDAVRTMREALIEMIEAYYELGGNWEDGVVEDARNALVGGRK